MGKNVHCFGWCHLVTPVNTPVPSPPWLLRTSHLISHSRASFDFGHGFDLHCVLFGRLGSGVPGYTRIFLGGRWGIWDGWDFWEKWGRQDVVCLMTGQEGVFFCLIMTWTWWDVNTNTLIEVETHASKKPVWYVCYQYNVSLLETLL